MNDGRRNVKVSELADGSVVVWDHAKATVVSVSHHEGQWRSADEPPPVKPTKAAAWRQASKERAGAAGWDCSYFRRGQEFVFVDMELATADGLVKLSLPSWWRCFVLDPHHAVCGACGGLWPCLEHRREMAGLRMMHDLAHACSACGENLGSAGVVRFTTPEGIRRQYHSAASRKKCRRMANEEANAAGLAIVWAGWDSKVVPVGQAEEQAVTGHVSGCIGDPVTFGCPGCIAHVGQR